MSASDFADPIPVTQLPVFGEGPLGNALAEQARVLGGTASLVAADGEACEQLIATMGPSDALVLVTHHEREADVPILAAALRGGVGYVGGLGSRTNEGSRRRRLLAIGLSEDEVACYRGPLGLDLAAASPAQTALAACAEILARLHGRTARRLIDTDAPIHSRLGVVMPILYNGECAYSYDSHEPANDLQNQI